LPSSTTSSHWPRSNSLFRLRAAVEAAREDEAALDEAAEWLDRADALLADLATVHSFSVPSRDHSEAALLGPVGTD
jgi:hypothetical protein